MNKKLEDKLAMLAFGDLSPEETRLLEQEVAGDAEATRVLEDYRLMRGGLKKMADIPEHQLSTDRLRHAILTQGLKPKAAKPSFGWLWMPGMAAALAFGIVVVRNMNNSHIPQINPGSVADRTLANPSESMTDFVKQPDNAFAFATASGEIISVEQPVMAVNAGPRRSHVYQASRNNFDSTKLESLKDAIQKEFASNAATPIALDSGSPVSGGRRAMAAEQSPIVLIDSAKDESTGAQKAKEVDSASNVLVGG